MAEVMDRDRLHNEMKRRAFLRSLGGAVAAAMLPFQKPIEPRMITGKWMANENVGIKAILDQCDRVVEMPSSGDFVNTFFFNKRIDANAVLAKWESL
jgi:hypothetical protein